MSSKESERSDDRASSQVRCLVVDDHAAIREGVKMILARDREISVIGECSSGDAAIEMAERRRPEALAARSWSEAAPAAPAGAAPVAAEPARPSGSCAPAGRAAAEQRSAASAAPAAPALAAEAAVAPSAPVALTVAATAWGRHRPRRVES
jgi:DNA-binding NarL/FixJ family response regulator